MKGLCRSLLLALALAALGASSAQACQRCGIAVVCNPNCDVIDVCKDLALPRGGYFCEFDYYGNCYPGDICSIAQRAPARALAAPVELAELLAPSCRRPARIG